jgi:hypothetical protein
LYIRSDTNRLVEGGYKGQIAMYYAARKWAHVVQAFWALVALLISSFGSN